MDLKKGRKAAERIDWKIAGTSLEDATPIAQEAARGYAELTRHDYPEQSAPAAVGYHYEAIKRSMDFVCAAGGLILLLPLFALIATLVKLTDWGPILFVQTRVGKHGRHFRFYKFRSMVVDAERMKRDLGLKNQHNDPRTFKIQNDPRITWIGYFLRRTSMDELPQLWNVLTGEMSLVGPRPPLPTEVELYAERDRLRLIVTPGLTGLWQIRGRGRLSFERQLELDLEYIRCRGLKKDLEILARTIPAVLSCRGAY